MLDIAEMHAKCGQCSFDFARIDMERWNNSSSRRAMCPVCGWTRYEEFHWNGSKPTLVKKGESHGFGAYRLVPPGGYSGYNAFHAAPPEDLISNLKELLTVKGWKGYLTVWDESAKRPRLVAGTPLHRYETALEEI